MFLALQRVGALIAQPFVPSDDVQEPDGPTCMHQFIVPPQESLFKLVKTQSSTAKGLGCLLPFYSFCLCTDLKPVRASSSHEQMSQIALRTSRS